MGLFVPCGAKGRNFDAIFAEKVPKIKKNENQKWLVGAEILAHLKWLIYSAAFKDPTAEPRGSIHTVYYRGWRCITEDILRQ